MNVESLEFGTTEKAEERSRIHNIHNSKSTERKYQEQEKKISSIKKKTLTKHCPRQTEIHFTHTHVVEQQQRWKIMDRQRTEESTHQTHWVLLNREHLNLVECSSDSAKKK